MSIGKDEIKHIAALARIALSEEELERFRGDMNKILGYIEVLKEVDTEGVEPLAAVTGMENVFREDVPEAPQIAADLVANAPDQTRGYIRVKKIL